MKRDALVVGLRATKKEATKVALVAAALDLFDRRGFEQTSIDEIAAKAGVGRSTFFRYFETKEDVVLDSRWDGAGLRQMLSERPVSEPAFRAVRSALHSMMLHFHSERGRMRQQVRIIKSVDTLRHRHLSRVTIWERIIAEFVAERRGTNHAEDAYAMAVGIAGSGAVRVAFYAWGEAPARSALPDMFAAAMDAFGAGLLNEPAAALADRAAPTRKITTIKKAGLK